MTAADKDSGRTEDEARHERVARPRRLRVYVGTLPIEDGQLRPPAVGEVTRLTLTFTEADGPEADGAEADAAVSTVAARAEPLRDGSPVGPGRQWDGTEREGPVTWPTVLHGDGWSATWSAPRPVLGQVHLRGRLVDDLEIGVRTGVRGRATRIQVITVTSVGSDPDQRHRVPGEQTVRDVEVAPRWFESGMVAPPDAQPGRWYSPVPADPWVRETGLIVDLDLDDVPALPPRPRLVPGALAAAGPDLWVADERLPLLVRIRDPRGEHPQVSEFSWPGRILGEDEAGLRALHADRHGCWITGTDGVRRAEQSRGVVEVDPLAVPRVPGRSGAAGSDGLLAAVVFPAVTDDGSDHPTLRRWTREGTTVADVDLGAGHVEGLVATADGGFLALRRDLPDGVPVVARRQPTWLTAIGPDGAVTHGPVLDIVGSWSGPLLAGDPPVVDDTRARPAALRRVHADLTVGDGAPARRMLLGGYAAAGRLWVAAHPPHPRDIERGGAAACWPLTEPPTYPEQRQYWLLTELDADDHEPLVSHLVPHVPRDVAVDDTGTVWVLADGVRHLPRGDGATADALDLEALLGPAQHGAH